MRKNVVVVVMAAVLAVLSLFPSLKSDAAFSPAQKNVFTAQPQFPETLPNYDIRLVGRGEFTDRDLNSAAATQSPVTKVAIQARVAAVDQFRSRLEPESANKVRAVVNEAGVLKNFFSAQGALSEPQSDSPDNVARAFLGQHAGLFALSSADNSNLVLVNEDPDNGTTFLKYAQTIGGIKVFDGGVQVVVNKYGQVLSVREGFLVSGQPKLKATINETAGIAKAFEYAGQKVDPSFVEIYARAAKSEMSRFANPLGPAHEDIISELNVLRVGDKTRLAWHIYADVGENQWYETLVDANSGELLLRFNLYVEAAQGTVYTVSPSAGPRSLVSFVGDTTINTAAGWMSNSPITMGNNVDAYLDTDGNDLPDGTGFVSGHAFAINQDFTFPFSTAVDPRTQQAAVITNLFYFNNIMHDFSYGLGFTETAGNFQSNNFGRGGLGNDFVRAEAQDGSGTNISNFATPPDGQHPRMQQFLFTAPNPDRDGSLDSDLVFHEYGHGISNRLIGNGGSALSGTQSLALGEGWSDYWAMTINNNGAIGEYTANNPNGFRRAFYTVPAAAVHNSYADVGSSGFNAHDDGEVWAATLWDLRAQLGKATTDRLVLYGMKFTPAHPSFLDARDGILQADQTLNGGANKCAIWIVFARHEMGYAAEGDDDRWHVPSIKLPSDCVSACNFAFSPASANPTHTGGPASFVVVNPGGCAWTAVSNSAFITITGGSSGLGNGTVNYSVATNPGNSARTGIITIAGGLTYTVTQLGFNAVFNPGFENGTNLWGLGGQTKWSDGNFPHGGVGYMMLGIADSSTSSLYQTIFVPAGGANLWFWLNVTTKEPAGVAVFDRLAIEVRDTSGLQLTNLTTFSNQNSGTAGVYGLRGPFSLNAFAGQVVRIHFQATNDAHLPTTFRVDDVLVQ